MALDRVFDATNFRHQRNDSMSPGRTRSTKTVRPTNENGVPLVPKGFQEYANGCSVPILSRICKHCANLWFRDPCDNHDFDYHKGKTWLDKVKGDWDLWLNMMRSVPGKPSWWKRTLFFAPNLVLASTYWAAVTVGGHKYFKTNDLAYHVGETEAARLLELVA